MVSNNNETESNEVARNTLESARIRYQGMADLLKELSEEMKEILNSTKDQPENRR